jgi:hypothetical protein
MTQAIQRRPFTAMRSSDNSQTTEFYGRSMLPSSLDILIIDYDVQ